MREVGGGEIGFVPKGTCSVGNCILDMNRADAEEEEKHSGEYDGYAAQDGKATPKSSR